MSLNLLINQIHEQFSSSRSNVYSDKKRDDHFINIYDVFISIKKLNDENQINTADFSTFKEILYYIISDLQYLDSSTLNVIPYEIVSCLELALNDWISTTNFILTTHLSNSFTDFYFFGNNNSEYFTQINNFLTTKSITTFKYRLIKITLPKTLSRDYLSSVVLYHELGHFIDFEYNFSERLLLKNNPTIDFLNLTLEKQLNHFKEFFADLFAAQYISDASNQYLSEITIDDLDCHTHPKTSERIRVVDKFLKNEDEKIINDFKEILLPFGKELKIRFEEKDSTTSNFFNFVPEIIESDEQLHYIYKTGWTIWKDETNPSFNGIPERQKYQMLNNLIEKSISSFFLLKNWNSIKK